MAAIENSPKQKGNSTKKFQKKSTRVDLTPMVDLVFLLITFFVFTTTMSKPTAMKVVMPNDETPTTTDICNSCVLTAALCKNDQIRYYEGDLANAKVYTTDYEGIRLIIQQKKQLVETTKGSGDQFTLIIKPTMESSFKNFVDITDEVTINNIKRYFIDDVRDAEAVKLFN